MISSIYLTGELGPLAGEYSRYVIVNRPTPSADHHFHEDSFRVVVHNVDQAKVRFLTAPDHSLCIVKGRLETDEEANRVLAERQMPQSGLVIIAEMTEVFTLRSDMERVAEGYPALK